MDEEEAPQPKISLTIGLLGAMVYGLFDVIGWVLLFFALDDFGILDTINAGIIFVLALKGINIVTSVITGVIEWVPYLGAILPTYSIGWFVTWYIDAHPDNKLGQVATKAAALKGGGKGAAGAAGTAEKAGAKGARAAAQAERKAGAALTSGGGAVGAERQSVSLAGKRPSQSIETPSSHGGPEQGKKPTENASLQKMLGGKENEMERFQEEVFQTPNTPSAPANDNDPKTTSEDETRAA